MLIQAIINAMDSGFASIVAAGEVSIVGAVFMEKEKLFMHGNRTLMAWSLRCPNSGHGSGQQTICFKLALEGTTSTNIHQVLPLQIGFSALEMSCSKMSSSHLYARLLPLVCARHASHLPPSSEDCQKSCADRAGNKAGSMTRSSDTAWGQERDTYRQFSEV